MKDTLIGRLAKIQQELKAPKNQFNKFGNYKYRSCEDIMEAVKPHLNGLALNLTDEVKEAAGYMYVEATAMVTDGNKMQAVKAQAGIPLIKKGMDLSQIYGASSSYARKYALNGLFLIDDNKDSDSTNIDKGVSEAVETKKEVLKLLKGYLEEQIELARRKSIDEDNFSLPSWSEYQAYQLGIQKALHKVNNLIKIYYELD